MVKCHTIWQASKTGFWMERQSRFWTRDLWYSENLGNYSSLARSSGWLRERVARLAWSSQNVSVLSFLNHFENLLEYHEVGWTSLRRKKPNSQLCTWVVWCTMIRLCCGSWWYRTAPQLSLVGERRVSSWRFDRGDADPYKPHHRNLPRSNQVESPSNWPCYGRKRRNLRSSGSF